jgi:hypothetical protein
LETDLYRPIKVHLERLGLEVKGEVCGCDLVALSDASPELVVIGEMKQSFTLELVLQAVDRTPPATRSGSPSAPPSGGAAGRMTRA